MTTVSKDQNIIIKEPSFESSQELTKNKRSLTLNKKQAVKRKATNLLFSQDKILQDLDEMYKAAFANQNFAIALRVLELRGKHLGLFGDKKVTPSRTLTQMTEEELQALLG